MSAVDSPEVAIRHQGNDHLVVTLRIPTYSGVAEFVTTVQQDQDGDWRVFLPDVEEFEVANNVVYLGGPDE